MAPVGLAAGLDVLAAVLLAAEAEPVWLLVGARVAEAELADADEASEAEAEAEAEAEEEAAEEADAEDRLDALALSDCTLAAEVAEATTEDTALPSDDRKELASS